MKKTNYKNTSFFFKNKLTKLTRSIGSVLDKITTTKTHQVQIFRFVTTVPKFYIFLNFIMFSMIHEQHLLPSRLHEHMVYSRVHRRSTYLQHCLTRSRFYLSLALRLWSLLTLSFSISSIKSDPLPPQWQEGNQRKQ